MYSLQIYFFKPLFTELWFENNINWLNWFELFSKIIGSKQLIHSRYSYFQYYFLFHFIFLFKRKCIPPLICWILEQLYCRFTFNDIYFSIIYWIEMIIVLILRIMQITMWLKSKIEILMMYSTFRSFHLFLRINNKIFLKMERNYD